MSAENNPQTLAHGALMLWEWTENKEEVKLAGTGAQGYGGYG